MSSSSSCSSLTDARALLRLHEVVFAHCNLVRIVSAQPGFLAVKISIKKATPHQCQYTIARDDGSTEVIELDTKTFLLHDICHYAVEKKLRYANGFWGLLAQGRAFGELFGKDNPVAAELRALEKIVGPLQSTAVGNIRREELPMFIAHLHEFHLPPQAVDECLAEVREIEHAWQQLAIGQCLSLHWD